MPKDDQIEPLEDLTTRHYRAIFLSDIHLGTRGCQAALLLEFLRFHDADLIYLIGDIVDGWRLRRSWYWPQAHNDIVQKILRKGRKGARIIYVPGNHDEFLRDYLDGHFGSIRIVGRAVHEGLDGKRHLILHGDEFDVVVRHARFLAILGDWAYDLALKANTTFNIVRRWLGFPYWSLSAWAKLKVKNAVNFIGEFERVVAEEARQNGVDGVICGHIHHAAIHDDYGIRYMNTGDWVESCTAIVETLDGAYRIIRWSEIYQKHVLAAATRKPLEAA